MIKSRQGIEKDNINYKINHVPAERLDCQLCSGAADLFKVFKNKVYYLCGGCGAVFLSPEYRLSAEGERARYLSHQNDVNDAGYQNFVKPIVSAVMENFNESHSGLDFGSGPGPVVSKLLGDKGYQVRLYDPFFCDDAAALETVYDYIVCCEVIEHFKDPVKEFKLLRSLLKDNGKLICMSLLYHPEIDFDKWRYKNDTTHLIFYQKKSLEWIRSRFAFSSLAIEGRLIVFSL